MQEVRLIDANALAESDMAKIIDGYLYNQCNLTVGLAAALMPEIDAEPVRHGRWIPVTTIRGGHECDKCRNYAPSYQNGEENLSDYCPYCGARMDATDTNVGGKGDEEMDLSPLDFLAAEYDRKHPQGIRFVDCMEGADDGACKKV